MESIEKVLRCAGLSQGDIDEIFLVNGSTRIPNKLWAMLSDYFNRKKLWKSYGAAIRLHT
jgi:molecular chaperone DnaK (HSP70)